MYGALLGFILGLLTRTKSQNHKTTNYNSSSTIEQKSNNQSIIPARIQISFSDEDKKESRAHQEQLYALQKSLKRAAWLTFWAVFIYAAITLAVWHATNKAADAAKESADTARDALIVSERPWITVAITFEEPPHAHSAKPGFFFNPDGTATLNAFISVKNIGHSIATSIYISPQMYPPAFNNMLTEPIDKQYLWCDKVRQQTSMDSKRLISLFPGEERTENFTFSMSKQDIQAAMQSGSFINQTTIIPVIYGCVNYNSGLFKGVRQTPFLYEMNPLRVAPGVIPASGLEFIKISRGKTPD